MYLGTDNEDDIANKFCSGFIQSALPNATGFRYQELTLKLKNILENLRTDSTTKEISFSLSISRNQKNSRTLFTIQGLTP